MPRKNRRRRSTAEAIIGPTEEQALRSAFELNDVLDTGGSGRRIGKAWRRERMVEALHKRGAISDDEARALRHYRHHADLCDRSPLRDSLNRERGGSGMGPTAAWLHAQRVATDCEAAAGSLCTVMRAVVVDDEPVQAWAERRRCRRALVELDIRMAARRVMAEMDA